MRNKDEENFKWKNKYSDPPGGATRLPGLFLNCKSAEIKENPFLPSRKLLDILLEQWRAAGDEVVKFNKPTF